MTNQALPSLRNILIIGNGGRENSLAWALAKCNGIEKVYIAPGNGGTNGLESCLSLEIPISSTKEIVKNCFNLKIDLVVIGPEAPLASGLADKLRDAGLTVFGPSCQGSQLEASKSWAKNLMKEADIPTANYWTVSTEKEAMKLLKELNKPLVVKVDGLAAGKGVSVNASIKSTELSIQEAFAGKFGSAGKKLVLEEVITGPEVSIFALCDGKEFIILPPAQDHKRLLNGDQGPNTGGMGAYAPAPLISEKQLEEVSKTILKPTLKTLQKRGIDYRGVIYAGLMLTKTGPKVIEFNCRFGDPECQTLMPLMGNEFAQVLQACAIGNLNQAPTLTIKKLCSSCIILAVSGYPEKPKKGDEVNIKVPKQENIQFFHSGTKVVNEKLITSGGRVLSIVAQGKDFNESFHKAYLAINAINFKGMHYREDIGYQVRENKNFIQEKKI